MILKTYPVRMIPTAQIPMKIPSSRGFTALRSITRLGRDSVMTPIMKAITTPSSAPFASSASTIGTVAKISAYMGIPNSAARNTPKGLPLPSTETTIWLPGPNYSVKHAGSGEFTVELTEKEQTVSVATSSMATNVTTHKLRRTDILARSSFSILGIL